MPRWLVHLKGEQCDLEEFSRRFPRGPHYVIEHFGEFYITGPAFASFTYADASRVKDDAAQLLDRMFLVISADWDSARRPQIGNVVLHDDAGVRHEFAIGAWHAEGRSKVLAVSVAAAPNQSTLTHDQKLLAAVDGNERLRAVAERWSNPNRTWPDLYAIFDELQALYCERLGSASGFCSRSEASRFTQSAQSTEVAGAHARHRTGYAPAPSKPMTLDEAERFISSLVAKVLRLL